MQLLKKTPNIDFMGRRRLWVALSGVLTVMALGIVIIRGLNLGIDFTGGLLLEVSYSGAAQLDEVRAVLENEGYPTALVQGFGTASDVLIRLPPVDDPVAGETLAAQIVGALREQDPGVRLLRTEFVGPQVGEDLAEQGGLAMLFATIMIFIYVMLRFRWKFAAGAIASLVHDAVMTLGFYAALGFVFDLTILAALLTVIGFSLNDTVVVFDRIRENFRSMRRGTPEEIINASLNQTLARTLMTGITTLLVLVGLATLGGQTLFGFSIALIFGILVGTYSSIYIASATLLELDVTSADLITPKREELDELP